MVTGLEEAKFNMSLETFSKYYFTTLEKCLRLTVGGTAHGAAEDETKLWFGFSRNEGFRLWAWLMYRTSSHGCGSFFFFFGCCCCLILSIRPPPPFSSFCLFCFLSLSLFLSLSSPPFYSSSPPSPSALSVPFHLSLAIPLLTQSLEQTNKQRVARVSYL